MADSTNAVDTCRSRDLSKLSGGDAKINTHSTAEQLLPSKPYCVSQGVAMLKKQPLLRVGAAGLSGGQPKRTIREALRPADEATRAQAGLQRRAQRLQLLRLPERRLVPARSDSQLQVTRRRVPANEQAGSDWAAAATASTRARTRS